MIRDTVEAVKSLIRKRSYSYKKLFHKQNGDAQVVLRDLAKFCKAHETTFNEDPRKHAALEGRREVWLRIEQYAKLDEQEILNLHEVKFRPKE